MFRRLRPRWPASLRMRLLWLVAAVALPLLGFGVLTMVLHARQDRVEVNQQVQELVASLAQAVNAQLNNAIVAAETLALDPNLVAGNLEAFRATATAFTTEQRYGSVGLAVFDRDGTLLMSPSLPPGSRAGRLDRAISAGIFADTRPLVSDLAVAPISHELRFAVDVPVLRDSRVIYDLEVAISPSLMQQMLDRIEVRSGWRVGVTDTQGTIVARLPRGHTGDRSNIDFLNAIRGIPQGVGRVRSVVDSADLLVGWTFVAPFGWRVTVGAPVDELLAPYWRLMALLGAGGLLILLLGFAAASRVARTISQPIGALAQIAGAAERGEAAAGFPSGLREVDRVAATLTAETRRRREAERASRDAEQRLGFLLALGDRLRAEPKLALNIAAEMLGRYTGASRAGYGEADASGETFTVTHEFADGVPPVEGAYPITDYGTDGAALLRAGGTLVVHDVAADPRTRNCIDLYRGYSTGAIIAVPMMRDGRIRAILHLSHYVPRHWTADEIVLVEDVAVRTASALEQGRAEAALHALNEQLEARVREAVAAREAAQARLVHAQRMEALGQLAGGIAHDFNNVLQAVQGAARLIGSHPEDERRVRRFVQMITDATSRGAGTTRRLLAFSRRADLRAEPVDAAELLAGVHEILAHTLGAGIVVRLKVAANLPPLLADKGQLETVLINLAANARDAIAGAGVVELSAGERVVSGADGHAPPLKPGRYICLAVSDDGAGMPPEVLARASEPFFTTKPQGKGTGLGLATARGFVEQSDGGFAIESALGRGTSVHLWLPVADAARAPAPGLAETQRPIAGASLARVLLVDDEALVQRVTAAGLEDAGFAVRIAGNGEEALRVLDAGEPVDVLVTDLSMPGMDGLALIRAAQERRPALPAILLTGYATDATELAVRGAISGRFSLLRKPIDTEQLAERVAVLLEGIGA